MESGLSTEKLNLRGLTSRAAYAGGDQEQELIARYREASAQLQLSWPRTAVVLNNLARSYLRDAWSYDDELDASQNEL